MSQGLALKFGCDPELFLRDKNTGVYVPAYGVIPGDKKNPHKVNKGAIQVDGLAVEFNIDPVSTVEEWNSNINTVMDELKNALPSHYELVISPTCTFDPDVYTALPQKALEMGCDPDYNAYTKQENPRPDPVGTMRTASGHVHIGWCEGKDVNDQDHFDDCVEVVKQLDFYLGLTSLIWDKDYTRRQMYGKAGAFRVKPYGVEYRVLSSAWLKSPMFTRFVFEAAKLAVEELFSGIALRTKFTTVYPGTFLNKRTKASPDYHYLFTSFGSKLFIEAFGSWSPEKLQIEAYRIEALNSPVKPEINASEAENMYQDYLRFQKYAMKHVDGVAPGLPKF